jgi:hypothetical protein
MNNSGVAGSMIEKGKRRDISSRKSKGAHDFSEPLLNNFFAKKRLK